MAWVYIGALTLKTDLPLREKSDSNVFVTLDWSNTPPELKQAFMVFAS